MTKASSWILSFWWYYLHKFPLDLKNKSKFDINTTYKLFWFRATEERIRSYHSSLLQKRKAESRKKRRTVFISSGTLCVAAFLIAHFHSGLSAVASMMIALASTSFVGISVTMATSSNSYKYGELKFDALIEEIKRRKGLEAQKLKN